MDIQFFQIEIGKPIYFDNNRIEEWKIKIKKYTYNSYYYSFSIRLYERIFGTWIKEEEEIILNYQDGITQPFFIIMKDVKFGLRISNVNFNSYINKIIIGMEITFNLIKLKSKIYSFQKSY